MKKRIIIILILAVVLVHSFFYSVKKDDSIGKDTLKVEGNVDKIDEVMESKTVNLIHNDKNVNISLEEYIIGVVACEMPASFEVEALKAMSVAARTFALNRMGNNALYDLTSSDGGQCYIDSDDMKNKWGNSFDKYYSRIEDAVAETEGQYMTYNGDVIVAFYFSISNGKTENVENVFSEKLDYLVSVDSSWDKDYFYKSDEVTYEFKDFFSKLGMDDTTFKTVDVDRSETGRVNKIVINGKEFKGTKFRTLLGLKSTDFEISFGKNIVIKTKGYGHGVGMSQYGAEGMAKDGKSYEEILKHYYTGIEIMYN